MKSRTTAVVLFTSILVIVFSTVLYAQEARDWPESVDAYVATVKKSVNAIDMEAFKKVVDNKGDAVIIDVREPDEYKSGFIAGSINIPRGLMEYRIWKAVAGYPAKTDTKKKIYLYCKLGGRAILAAKALKDVGFTNVIAVDMKMADWIKAGYPVQR